MNSGAASGRECNPPVAGAASKRPSENSGEEPPRKKDRVPSRASGEDLSRTDAIGRSPLHHAALDGDLERVRELIARGADTRLRDRGGMTPLHRALCFEKVAAAELLAEADSGNDVQDEDGHTPLHRAATKGYLNTIRHLLAGGSRTRVQDKWGETPLHQALAYDREEAAELLAEADGEIDVQDGGGLTPLHLASYKGFEGVVRKLVRSGTKPHVEDGWGRYPIQAALRWGKNENIPKMLLSMYALKGIAIDWEELRLGENDRQFCMEALSRCHAEIRRMEDTRVPASSVSHHHLVTRHVCRVASRLRIERVGGVSRSDLARRDFPVYADLIASKLRGAEERRVRADRCQECFSLLSPPLPPTCTDVVLLCLADGDLENVVRAFLLES